MMKRFGLLNMTMRLVLEPEHLLLLSFYALNLEIM